MLKLKSLYLSLVVIILLTQARKVSAASITVLSLPNFSISPSDGTVLTVDTNVYPDDMLPVTATGQVNSGFTYEVKDVNDQYGPASKFSITESASLSLDGSFMAIYPGGSQTLPFSPGDDIQVPLSTELGKIYKKLPQGFHTVTVSFTLSPSNSNIPIIIPSSLRNGNGRSIHYDFQGGMRGTPQQSEFFGTTTLSQTNNFTIKTVPEPLTILGSGIALGCGVLMERQYSRKRKKTKQIG